MKHVIVKGQLDVGIEGIVGPFDSHEEAQEEMYNLGLDEATASVHSMESLEEYWGSEVCST